MNRLWVRLTLAFVLVTVITVSAVSALIGQTTDEDFRTYLMHRNQGIMSGRHMGEGDTPPMMLAAEIAFMNRLRQTLILTAIGTGILGVVLGVVISRTIAAPLGNLANAARDFAAHRWDRRVPVKGTAEIIAVAQAFNAMADELQRAETLRRNLMADIAHELRTPLTVIQGSLRALLDGVYPLEMKEIASLYDETRILSRLVGDLRELALADAGQLSLSVQRIPINPLLEQAVERFMPAAELQHTELALADQTALPAISGDPDRLMQVLHNLIANALRHTPGGRVTVRGESLADGVRVSVCDTGQGIAQDDLPHVFDRFYRADESRARATGGTGLGLAIAKAWIEAMGGEIGVESAENRGSTFWFTLPKAVRG